LDLESGKTESIADSDVDAIEHTMLSLQGARIYYVASCKRANVDAELVKFDVRRFDLDSKKKKVLFSMPPKTIPVRFSVSPNKRFVLLSALEKLKDEEEKTFLIVGDVKTSEMFKVGLGTLKGE